MNEILEELEREMRKARAAYPNNPGHAYYRANCQTKKHGKLNESTIIVRYIIPELEHLGWKRFEFLVQTHNLDIILLESDDTINTIIEAKCTNYLNTKKTIELGAMQLRRYLALYNLNFGYLTDGGNWYYITENEITRILPEDYLSKMTLIIGDSVDGPKAQKFLQIQHVPVSISMKIYLDKPPELISFDGKKHYIGVEQIQTFIQNE